MPEDSGAGGGVGESHGGAGFESPPGAAMPERREVDPRARLHELALELTRTRNRRLLVEYLRLRRAVR
ncbi:MAG TPA: hypothetical protein VH475_14210 [Tepidisphaeraceae bacterium]